MIRLRISPSSIGLTPRFLSKGIKWAGVVGNILSDSKSLVVIREASLVLQIGRRLSYIQKYSRPFIRVQSRWAVDSAFFHGTLPDRRSVKDTGLMGAIVLVLI